MLILDDKTSKPESELPRLDWIPLAADWLFAEILPPTTVEPYLTNVI